MEVKQIRSCGGKVIINCIVKDMPAIDDSSELSAYMIWLE